MEDKTKTMLTQIEKLIVDGNKEVLKRLDNLEAGQHTLEAGQYTLEAGQHTLEAGQYTLEAGQHTLEAGQHTLEAGQHTLEAGQQRLEQKLETLSKTLDVTAQASYSLLTDVRDDVKRVEKKLDDHCKMPAHV